MAETTQMPEALAAIPAESRVELDVRKILKNGGEPFGEIMQAVARVPSNGALRLRATFKPVPLFGVMNVKGFDHWIEYGEGDDWVVWFYR